MADVSKVQHIRYIKLGRGGGWAKECFKRGIIRLGFATEREDIRSWAKTGDWTSIRNFWVERECGTPTAHTNQTQKFFDDAGDVLWVTFENGSL